MGDEKMRVLSPALLLITSVWLSVGAKAETCGAVDPDDPMAWSEGFGIGECRARAAGYHRDDYDGEQARGYADSSDPMVWSDEQWRSTLFPGYARNYDDRYDRRSRREARSMAQQALRVERQVEISIVNDAEHADNERPRGPKLITPRAPSDMKTTTGVLRFGGHDCRGVLVLTWGTLGSKSRCYSGDGRVRTPD
jgi:hypothetical protein